MVVAYNTVGGERGLSKRVVEIRKSVHLGRVEMTWFNRTLDHWSDVPTTTNIRIPTFSFILLVTVGFSSVIFLFVIEMCLTEEPGNKSRITQRCGR